MKGGRHGDASEGARGGDGVQGQPDRSVRGQRQGKRVGASIDGEAFADVGKDIIGKRAKNRSAVGVVGGEREVDAGVDGEAGEGGKAG